MIAPIVVGVLGVMWLASRGANQRKPESGGTLLDITARSAGLPSARVIARVPQQLPDALPGETPAEKQERALAVARAIARAIASGSAVRMRALANELEAAGGPEAAAELRAAAAEIEQIQAAADRIAPIVATTAAAELPVEPIERTIAQILTRHLWPGPLSGVRRYAENRDLVTKFQRSSGLTTDGMYGVGTGLAVAGLGLVPARPYYFSRDAAKARAQKALWARSMLAHAATDPQRAPLWRQAAEVDAL